MLGLFEVVAGHAPVGEIAARLAVDVDQVAPHVMTLRDGRYPRPSPARHLDARPLGRR